MGTLKFRRLCVNFVRGSLAVRRLPLLFSSYPLPQHTRLKKPFRYLPFETKQPAGLLKDASYPSHGSKQEGNACHMTLVLVLPQCRFSLWSSFVRIFSRYPHQGHNSDNG